MRFFCELCGGPNDSVGRCLRRCEAESRGPRRSAYTSAEARIKELEEQAERCECDKHDWEQAGGRIKDLEDALAAIHEIACEVERGNTQDALARPIANIIEWCKTDKLPEWAERLADWLEARLARAEEHPPDWTCDDAADFQQERDEAKARIRELETRLEAVKALCDEAIAEEHADSEAACAVCLAQDVLKAAEGKP